MRFILILSIITLFYRSTFSGDTVSYKQRAITPSAEKSIAAMQRRDSVKNECSNKYGREIAGKTDSLRIQMQEYFHHEQMLLMQKLTNDPDLAKIKSEIQITITDSVQKTTAEKSAYLQLLTKERDSLERKARIDPEVVEVHRNFVRTKELINQIIRDIINGDSACVSCMSIGAK
jgi:hypothetical protein